MSRICLAPALATLVSLALAVAACGDDDSGRVGGQDTLGDAADSSLVDAGDSQAPTDTSVTDTAADADVAAEVAACKTQLANGQPYMALQRAEAALAIAPDDVDANFCAALAGVIDRTEFALSLFKVLDMASTYNGLVYEPTYSEELAEELHGIFGYLHAGYALAVERLDRIRDDALAFDVEVASVYDGPRPLLLHRGRFDRGDLLLTRAIARFAVGFVDIFYGQDLRGDVATLVTFLADQGVGGGFDLSTLSELLGYLLATDQRFLTLHPDDGVAAFLEAREVLADWGPDMREALEAIEAAPAEPGVDEVSTAEPLGGGGYRLTVRGRVVVDGDALVEEDISIEISPDVLAGLFTIEGLAELLAALIPAPAAFDMGAFYANPVGLRAILPLGEARGGFGEDRLMASWECLEDLDASGFPQGAQGFVCSADANVTDAAHFVGTPQALAADGYASGFPVMAWEDPTWNGLLYVDLSEALPGTAPGWVATDEVTINILLAETLTPVLDLFGD